MVSCDWWLVVMVVVAVRCYLWVLFALLSFNVVFVLFLCAFFYCLLRSIALPSLSIFVVFFLGGLVWFPV